MEKILELESKRINWTRLLLCVIGVVLLGSVSGLANAGNIEGWYAGLEKPSFNPPNGLFGPVWTVLYVLMGVGLYLIWQVPSSNARNQALTVFFVQLLFNFSWSFIFFFFHLPGWAAVEIVFLELLIIGMIIMFFRVNKLAALLQIPYLLWVSFATVLNISIWWLNR